jgi:hypothetical protein
MMNYTRNVYARIISFCENLNNFNVDQSFNEECPPLSLHDLPSTTFFSSTLTKLTIGLSCFTDCLCLLDGRLKQLTNLIVTINTSVNSTLIVSNSVSLMKNMVYLNELFLYFLG